MTPEDQPLAHECIHLPLPCDEWIQWSTERWLRAEAVFSFHAGLCASL